MWVDNRYIQVFVVNDITEHLENEKIKMKHNFSKQLTATLCHEIKTPLNCIINSSDFLLMSCEAIIDYAFKIKIKESQRLIQLAKCPMQLA